MEQNYILSIDQSTSGTKALLFDKTGALVARHDKAHRQITNSLGWVEHDPNEIYQNMLFTAGQVLQNAQINPAQVRAIGISNQRETGVMWDRKGEPIYHAVVWQCARGKEICQELEAQGLASFVKDTTGLNLSPYFTAAKWAWLMRNVRDAKALAQRGDFFCGTMDSWLIFKLTGNHKTDYSNASRTQLFDIGTLTWNEELCRAFGIPVFSLPEVCFSDSIFGTTDFEGLFPKKIPVCGVMGDSHAALFAQGCWTSGMTKATYGTGSSVMMNTGERRVFHKDLVSSLAWGIGGKVSYVLEGNINYTGAVFQWLCDDLKLISSPKEASSLASSVKSSDGVYLIPAFSGLGAPYWQSEARALLCGMGRNTRKEHIVRAAEECIAYQIKDIIEAMNQGSDYRLPQLRVDGGPTHDAFLMQFQADILGVPVAVSKMEELSGGGAAYLAGISSGLYLKETLLQNCCPELFSPSMKGEEIAHLYNGWKRAVRRTIFCPEVL